MTAILYARSRVRSDHRITTSQHHTIDESGNGDASAFDCEEKGDDHEMAEEQQRQMGDGGRWVPEMEGKSTRRMVHESQCKRRQRLNERP